MKHGIKLRKLQRTPSHRYALLRNLVSALLHHEMIKTTVPKAKEAARMAEKLITLGKRGTNPSISKAQAFLQPPHTIGESSLPLKVKPFPAPGVDLEMQPRTLLHKVFNNLSERYAERPGGYTRITKFGRRPGDHAPMALVSLVDGPRDIKFEMAARAAAREATIVHRDTGSPAPMGFLGTRPLTVRNVKQVLKYRSDEDKYRFTELARDFSNALVVENKVVGPRREAPPSPYRFKQPGLAKPMTGRRVLAGERLPGMSVSHTGLGLARAQLARPRNGNDPTKVDRSPLFASQKLGGGGAFEELNPVREIKPVKVRKYGRQPEPGQGRHNKQRKLREREQREQ